MAANFVDALLAAREPLPSDPAPGGGPNAMMNQFVADALLEGALEAQFDFAPAAVPLAAAGVRLNAGPRIVSGLRGLVQRLVKGAPKGGQPSYPTLPQLPVASASGMESVPVPLVPLQVRSPFQLNAPLGVSADPFSGAFYWASGLGYTPRTLREILADPNLSTFIQNLGPGAFMGGSVSDPLVAARWQRFARENLERLPSGIPGTTSLIRPTRGGRVDPHAGTIVTYGQSGQPLAAGRWFGDHVNFLAADPDAPSFGQARAVQNVLDAFMRFGVTEPGGYSPFTARILDHLRRLTGNAPGGTPPAGPPP